MWALSWWIQTRICWVRGDSNWVKWVDHWVRWWKVICKRARWLNLSGKTTKANSRLIWGARRDRILCMTILSRSLMDQSLTMTWIRAEMRKCKWRVNLTKPKNCWCRQENCRFLSTKNVWCLCSPAAKPNKSFVFSKQLVCRMRQVRSTIEITHSVGNSCSLSGEISLIKCARIWHQAGYTKMAPFIQDATSTISSWNSKCTHSSQDWSKPWKKVWISMKDVCQRWTSNKRFPSDYHLENHILST